MYDAKKLLRKLTVEPDRVGNLDYELYEMCKQHTVKKREHLLQRMEPLWEQFNEIVGSSRSPLLKLYKSNHPNAKELIEIVFTLASVVRCMCWLDGSVNGVIKYVD